MRELKAAGSRLVMEPGTLDRLGEFVAGAVKAHRVAIVTDKNVEPLYAARARQALAALSPVVVSIPAGESHKTRETWLRITDEILAHGIGRDGVIVALGGGVVGDLAGFVAATYMRGIPVIQVPTSLVAMIDASIGGKTGVDVPAGKNLVGAFLAPALIAIDTDLLATLPARELRGGLAEALKHGAVADAGYFDRIAADVTALRDPARATSLPMRQVVTGSVAIKCDVVNSDPLENGRRKILNFGHTLGHAIEAASGYELRHGEAIAVGMVLEATLGERLGVTAAGTAARLKHALADAGLPTHTTLNPEQLVARTYGDKKKVAGRVEYSLPAEIGRFEKFTTPVDDADVLAILKAS
jgi:3-dehydroquinate synthase